jgi:hypothetical protein
MQSNNRLEYQAISVNQSKRSEMNAVRLITYNPTAGTIKIPHKNVAKPVTSAMYDIILTALYLFFLSFTYLCPYALLLLCCVFLRFNFSFPRTVQPSNRPTLPPSNRLTVQPFLSSSLIFQPLQSRQFPACFPTRVISTEVPVLAFAIHRMPPGRKHGGGVEKSGHRIELNPLPV